MPVLSAVLLTFSYQLVLLFFNISLTRPRQSHAAPALQHTIGQYRTMDVAKNLGKSLSGMQHTSQGKDVKLILTLKMETRHPIGGLLNRAFSAFVIIAEL